MQTPVQTRGTRRDNLLMRRAVEWMRKTLKIAGIVILCAIVALCGVVIYLLHNPNRYLPRAIAYAQQRSGLQIEVSRLTIHLAPLSVQLYDIGIRNPEPFPQGHLFKAPFVNVALSWRPLLHRQIEIRSLTIDRPVIAVISDPDGIWNFQNPQSSKTQPARFSFGTISRLEIDHGNLQGSGLIDPSYKPGPVVVTVEDFSGVVNKLDLKALKNSSAKPIAGSLNATRARFGDIHATDLHSQIEILPAKIKMKNFTAKTYRGLAKGNFTFNFAENKTRFNTSVSVTGVGINYLLADFETDPPKITGMMHADIQAAGTIEHTANPLAGVHGTGTFKVQKGEMTGLNSNKSMVQMKRFRNPSAAALSVGAFASFGGDVNLTRQKIVSHRIAIDFYGIDVAVSGNVDEVTGVLDYKGEVTIQQKQGFFTSTFARMFKGAKTKDGKLVFPVRVTGTASNPRCAIAR